MGDDLGHGEELDLSSIYGITFHAGSTEPSSRVELQCRSALPALLPALALLMTSALLEEVFGDRQTFHIVPKKKKKTKTEPDTFPVAN